MLNELVNMYYDIGGQFVYGEAMEISKEDTALILIDVQSCITREHYEEYFGSPLIKELLAETDLDEAKFAEFFDELGAYINPRLDNVARVLDKCRKSGIRPIHIKIESLLPDAADTGRLHTSAMQQTPPGHPDSFFLPQAQPVEGEIVLTKTCSGAFIGTQIDRILRNLHVTKVIVVGFYTDQCVSSTVRDFADAGYEVTMVEDACGAFSPERHNNAMQSLRNMYAHVETTDEILSRLSAL